MQPEKAETNGRVVVRRWTRHRASVGHARAELRKTLAGWGLADLENGALVILSELLSNAVLHAHVPQGREIETRFIKEADGVRIEVHDAAETWPQKRTAAPDAEFGRGLTLVSALARDWGRHQKGRRGEVGVGTGHGGPCGAAGVMARHSMRVVAIGVRRGDRVGVQGHWRQVKAARMERYAAGGPAVVLIFTSGPALRVNAGNRVTVQRERRGRLLWGAGR